MNFDKVPRFEFLMEEIAILQGKPDFLPGPPSTTLSFLVDLIYSGDFFQGI